MSKYGLSRGLGQLYLGVFCEVLLARITSPIRQTISVFWGYFAKNANRNEPQNSRSYTIAAEAT